MVLGSVTRKWGSWDPEWARREGHSLSKRHRHQPEGGEGTRIPDLTVTVQHSYGDGSSSLRLSVFRDKFKDSFLNQPGYTSRQMGSGYLRRVPLPRPLIYTESPDCTLGSQTFDKVPRPLSDHPDVLSLVRYPRPVMG